MGPCPGSHPNPALGPSLTLRRSHPGEAQQAPGVGVMFTMFTMGRGPGAPVEFHPTVILDSLPHEIRPYFGRDIVAL